MAISRLLESLPHLLGAPLGDKDKDKNRIIPVPPFRSKYESRCRPPLLRARHTKAGHRRPQRGRGTGENREPPLAHGRGGQVLGGLHGSVPPRQGGGRDLPEDRGSPRHRGGQRLNKEYRDFNKHFAPDYYGKSEEFAKRVQDEILGPRAFKGTA